MAISGNITEGRAAENCAPSSPLFELDIFGATVGETFSALLFELDIFGATVWETFSVRNTGVPPPPPSCGWILSFKKPPVKLSVPQSAVKHAATTLRAVSIRNSGLSSKLTIL
jgi:hypothetical protein